jgi:hypothetical protein
MTNETFIQPEIEETPEERYLMGCISRLQLEHEAALKPYIDRLIAIKVMQSPPPILVSIEQAKALADAGVLEGWRTTSGSIGQS